MSVLRNCRLVVFGRRVHHGELCVIGLAIAALGVLDDWADRREWFKRRSR